MHLETLLPRLVFAISLKYIVAIHIQSEEEPVVHENFDIVNNADSAQNKNRTSFYSYLAVDIDGMPHNLSQHFGKASLVVNVASQCGYTDSHYKDLVNLQNAMPSPDFTVLAFPCNQFGGQEPLSNKEIKSFARNHYQVNFPLFSKVDVHGANVPSYWHHLMNQSGHQPSWNFWKYLVNYRGEVLHAWGPWVSVQSIRPIIDQAVKQASRFKQLPEL